MYIAQRSRRATPAPHTLPPPAPGTLQKLTLTNWVDIGIWIFWVAVVAGVAGFIVGARLNYRVTLESATLHAARMQVEAEMRAACTNWFTDSRSRDLPAGRIVVCKAPEFMSLK